ncbi:hypothetical protein PENTCL1PPCAC_21667, partial [Pristionchus entomophagus]
TADGRFVPMSGVNVELWEQDGRPAADGHDKQSSMKTDRNGRFEGLEGEESEIGKIRFFLRMQAPCKKEIGSWQNECADMDFVVQCKGLYLMNADVNKEKLIAHFSHKFEYNKADESKEAPRENYDLDCTLGFKSEKESFHGLSCTGGLCEEGRCKADEYDFTPTYEPETVTVPPIEPCPDCSTPNHNYRLLSFSVSIIVLAFLA